MQNSCSLECEVAASAAALGVTSAGDYSVEWSSIKAIFRCISTTGTALLLSSSFTLPSSHLLGWNLLNEQEQHDLRALTIFRSVYLKAVQYE